MHPILFRESFFFCSRDDLERVQPLSQTLLNMIVNGSKVLPLRPIHSVYTNCRLLDQRIQIFLVNDDYDPPDYHASVYEGDFAETFRHLQNTCIKSFYVYICDSPFHRYWKAQEAASFKVTSIHVDTSETMDYGLLDSIVNHLRPRTTTEEVGVKDSSWHENGYNSKILKLLARDSFLSNLQTCRLIVLEDDFPPSSFILNEPGYPNYELCCSDCKVVDGIDGLIESFVRDGCPNKKLESVCIKWHEWDGDSSLAPKQLSSKPRKVVMPLPENNLTALLISDVRRVTQCEVHSFVNTKQWKQMEVYKWSVEYDGWGDLNTTHSVEHEYIAGRCTTHVLQCRVKNVF